MSDLLTPIIRAMRKGIGPAIPSVCSAHPDVIAAGLRQAREHNMPALIEATSNQVNQFGGYTGMTPADFITFVRDIATSHGLGDVPVILGGDHLGPQAWRNLSSDAAMSHAEVMIAAYVRAGFTKIHLDCSEGCQGEPAQVGDALAAARAARLAAVAEAAAPDPEALTYIVGTEVPPPGGARHDDEGILPTPPGNARATLAAHEEAFAAAGASAAWARVRGLVVQPGLEFAPASIHRFDLSQADALSPVLGANDVLCFEAHSTDYQSPEVYADLTRRNFGILKVGPALTFAWREALYALSHVRAWIDGSPHISERMETLMLEQPKYWQGHYHGEGDSLRLMRHFGYADRIRYYWPRAEAEVQGLCAALDGPLPAPLLLQYLPTATLERASRLDLPPARAILQAHVEQTLAAYYPEETC
ncbi:class II D-tagatose-bisphosphate aldolase, non-catalytic subunit [Paracoccus litorisediminis]|jgi:D-tagatose-bisphosphate aldolase class II non-catalytic subunit|uniref:Tagatose-6-phosphate kinase n=1 Tax=Paracoccus litorisediminis TaxID=2006130 RepID=A0A844HN23_9RHOB|nr:class II D-tagatose-bisphosphate aldolase, non-catalytic subunit [Paracoccus litorisediminis]MTH60489.1 tagatose-6-phosphate kinase [Paracoccus litorisediminis]